MEYELGTIKVTAELKEEPESKIQTLSDVTSKYRHLGEKQKEHFYTVFLTNDNTEIGDKLIALGTRDSVTIDIQDIARTALLVNAAAAILVHNHPSRNPEPTHQDIETTREIYEALDQLGIQLLDHVIITENDSHSMKGYNDGPFQNLGGGENQ